MKVTANQNKAVLRHYNRITGSNAIDVRDIPSEVLSYLYLMDYKELVSGFAREMLINKESQDDICFILGLTRRELQTIGYKIGLCAK